MPKPVLFDPGTPTDVIASKTGFVTKLQVLRGAPQVQRGSAVLAGETLISGAVGSKFSGTYLVHSVGDAEAETYYELLAETPAQTQQKTYTGGKTTRWALIVGKNRYNFYRNSSICSATCDKINSVYNIGIRGLFSLPVSLVRETEREYALQPQRTDAADAVRAMEDALYAALLRSIGPDGAVLSEHWTSAESNGCYAVCLRARCSEHIGAETPMNEEQILQIKGRP